MSTLIRMDRPRTTAELNSAHAPINICLCSDGLNVRVHILRALRSWTAVSTHRCQLYR